MQFCDCAEIVCRISDDNYIPMLLQICKKYKVNCLIPTIDTDLLFLAKNRTFFEAIETKGLIADPEKVAICRDKYWGLNHQFNI